MTNKSLDEIKNFTFPSLVEGSEWYIKFYAFDPVQNKMRRKKIKLNHIKKIGDRRKYAQYLLKKLTKNLENGWNPWIEEENRKAYCSFSDACTHYRRHIAKQLDEGLLREDTYRSYISQLKNIEGWNARRKEPIVYIFNFDRGVINEFLEYIYIERKNTAQTRNNYLTFIRLFCSFLMEQQYVKTKPSDGISAFNKRKLNKQRKVIGERDIIRLCEYLNAHNKHYLLACYVIHYCLVRRKEMSYLKLKDISLHRQILFINGEHSKNGKDEIVTLPVKVIELMTDLNIFSYPKDYYLFSDNFKPGNERKHEKQFTDYWAYHIRKELNFPPEYQFYSLKDTGITNMLRHYDVLTVRNQARHSSIQMTDKYTPHDIKTANAELKNMQGML